MTCAEKLDYSEEEVRRFNLTLVSLPDCAQRQDTDQAVWSQIWMQWMTTTSIVFLPAKDKSSINPSLGFV